MYYNSLLRDMRGEIFRHVIPATVVVIIPNYKLLTLIVVRLLETLRAVFANSGTVATVPWYGSNETAFFLFQHNGTYI
ncbi:hypothetical protein GJ744_011980 [Endocarpon pusillum]|uniref:Uncharacterized protein n=1 Tax=Endocarpon pusillum TaxID=364733 RepID=A0A8H7E893_9EURO|nr:hypothetical protein GJ744_011980 [Endocarpon pusillum]